MVGGWGNRTHRALGCKQDKQPGSNPIIPSGASRAEGNMYLWRKAILLQKWSEGDSKREEGMSGVHNRLLKLAASSVQGGTINRWAEGD